jgi:hypothetical protein
VLLQVLLVVLVVLVEQQQPAEEKRKAVGVSLALECGVRSACGRLHSSRTGSSGSPPVLLVLLVLPGVVEEQQPAEKRGTQGGCVVCLC